MTQSVGIPVVFDLVAEEVPERVQSRSGYRAGGRWGFGTGSSQLLRENGIDVLSFLGLDEPNPNPVLAFALGAEVILEGARLGPVPCPKPITRKADASLQSP